ncbi:lipase [Alicyclobacillus contaminans]|nr:lipase [Alicyclobacillus contaminans]
MIPFVALGDSITAGLGATQATLGYPQLDRLLHGRSLFRSEVHGQVLAQPGWTSRDLVAAVWEAGTMPLRAAKVVIIWIGGDDLAYSGITRLQGAPAQVVSRALTRYGKDLETLIRTVRTVGKANVVVCTQYNPFPNSPIATEALSALNQVTHTVAHQTHAALAPTDAWFEGRQTELIAGYRSGRLTDALSSHPTPIHPNNRGHRVIAEGLASVLHPLLA